ncbi:MAG: menaquinone biosynthesis protein [Gemmatales bacterium]|nr:menaquinone biosynthesis protein [Gemmatales bacterium]MDW7993334.1 menaquinone biosynthesis protein [Gemmatales bacterium]
MKLRIGAVEYLNAKPLICDLSQLLPEAELVLEVPSRLADDLAAGRLDVGLIPVIEYFRGDGYWIVPEIAIASYGPVLSVTLFARKPWLELNSVALDEGSRTSAALARVLMEHRYQKNVEWLPLPLGASPESSEADAVLLIGDRAMRAALPGFPFSYDLGREWHEWTGLPFVYAVWVARSGVSKERLVPALLEAKRRGMLRLAQIAWDESRRLGLDAAFCRRYLDTVIRYDLGPRELEGLRYFYRLACATGLAPPGKTIRIGEPKVVMDLSIH